MPGTEDRDVVRRVLIATAKEQSYAYKVVCCSDDEVTPALIEIINGSCGGVCLHIKSLCLNAKDEPGEAWVSLTITEIQELVIKLIMIIQEQKMDGRE